MTAIPPIFISHGAPTLAIEDAPAREFLQGLAKSLPRPRAILAVSAHWETAEPTVNAVAVNETIHDFHGFPEEYYRLEYPAPGSPLLAGEVDELLGDAGFKCRVDEERGLDHGAWEPLMLAYPDAHLPVVQLSIQTALGPTHHYHVGRALEPLTREDVLIMGSGSFTHDLSFLRSGSGRPDSRGAEEPEWVKSFAEWMEQAILEDRIGDLLAYRKLAPYAERNHPTEEHLLPLFVALGAAGENPRPEHLHSSVTYDVLRMDAYKFNPAFEPNW
jgi:4,5-DOPA dioxygenase extradiol